MKAGSADMTVPVTRMRELSADLDRRAPQWAKRLAEATSDREVLDTIRDMFNLAHGLVPEKGTTSCTTDIQFRIGEFVTANLHQGVRLKRLAQFLGYSEKYCAALFHSVMGVSFSEYSRTRRIEKAKHLLLETDQPLGQIASHLGFSDQFAFSHFFKRTVGRAPLHYRNGNTGNHRKQPGTE